MCCSKNNAYKLDCQQSSISIPNFIHPRAIITEFGIVRPSPRCTYQIVAMAGMLIVKNAITIVRFFRMNIAWCVSSCLPSCPSLFEKVDILLNTLPIWGIIYLNDTVLPELQQKDSIPVFLTRILQIGSLPSTKTIYLDCVF